MFRSNRSMSLITLSGMGMPVRSSRRSLTLLPGHFERQYLVHPHRILRFPKKIPPIPHTNTRMGVPVVCSTAMSPCKNHRSNKKVCPKTHTKYTKSAFFFLKIRQRLQLGTRSYIGGVLNAQTADHPQYLVQRCLSRARAADPVRLDRHHALLHRELPDLINGDTFSQRVRDLGCHFE